MEHFYSTFFSYIENFIPLPDQDKTLIRHLFQPASFSKKILIAKAGEIPQFHNFVVSGFLRNFSTDDNGDEITNDLNNGPRFFTSYSSFLNQTISTENIQCLTDCHVLQISREAVDIAANEGLVQKDFSLIILNMHLEANKQRALDMKNLSSEKSFEKFAVENPGILQNVSLNHIASYLGITRRHLTRIRQSPNAK